VPPNPLPRRIAVRLADLRRHYEALALVLERTSHEEFQSAARASDPEGLARSVYPVERGSEILGNYVAELVELGLRQLGIEPGDRTASLRLLQQEGVIGSERRRRLHGALRARNALQHEYPDVRADMTYDAATGLLAELPGFLRDYARWLRRLGYGDDEQI